MTAKQYLGRVHQLRRQCESLERRILLLRAKAEGLRGITYNKDKVQVSPTNTIEEAVTELVNLESRYKELIIRYSEAITTRIEQIQGLDDPRHIEVLTLRYIEEEPRARNGQLSFDDIADRMHYSTKHIRHLHGAALQTFADKYLNDEAKGAF